jgi:hypothetical protein
MRHLTTADEIRGELSRGLAEGRWVFVSGRPSATLLAVLATWAQAHGHDAAVGRCLTTARLGGRPTFVAFATFPRAALTDDQAREFLREFAPGAALGELPPVLILAADGTEVRELSAFVGAADRGRLRTPGELAARN